MVRRRAAVQSDDSDGASSHDESTPAKRTRVEAVSDEDAPPRKHAKKSKGKSKQRNAVEGEAEVEETDDDELDKRLHNNLSRVVTEQDDEEFERTHEATLLDAISKREKKEGSIANMGIIESIEMHQFMCHPRLSFKFGPQINFIIGGKSAVLSALTIALGGKATSTGRGNGLKTFIREGQSTSEVTISIKNQGEEAFKPEVYGKSISITRRFTKEGSSSYKIKSTDGKIVSTKREELSAICDHMNIQVDNPMNVLTQDSARQFLSASHPTDKYQLFLKGTQLTQLSEEYETCLENIGKTTRTLQLKREEIPELQKAYDEAEARNIEATKAREKQSELGVLKCELAWAHVKTKEDEMTKKLEDVAKLTRRIQKINENIEEAATRVQEANTNIEDLEQEFIAMPGIDAIKAEHAKIKEQIKKNRDDIGECKSSEREMNQQIIALQSTIDGLDAEIAKETANLHGNTQEEREEVLRKLKAAEAECQAATDELKLRTNEREERQRQVERDRMQGKQAEEQLNRARQDIDAAISNVEQCRRSDRDEISLFGKDLSAVLARIQKESWAGEVPLGPFGIFVSAKDPKWAEVMRTQLGQAMTSFAVTDNRDRHKLKHLLNQSGNNQAQIIVSDVDLFDYSGGEPDERVLTVLRALEIKNEFIKRILINQRSIERVVLAETRADGDHLLLQLGGAGLAWTADGYIVRRYAEGGGTSLPIPKLTNQDPRQHMFTSTDRSADIRRWEDLRSEAETRAREATNLRDACLQRFRETQAEVKRTGDREKWLRNQVEKLRPQIIRLRDESIVEAPVVIGTLEQAKQEACEEKGSITDQYKQVVDRRYALDAANMPLVQKRDALDTQISDWQESQNVMKNKIASAAQKRVEATSNKAHWEQKQAEEKTKMEDMEKVAELVQTEFQDWSAKAERIGPQVDNPRKPEVVKRKISSVEDVLRQHERRQGATPEEIAIERDKAKLALDNHMRQLDEVSKLNKALKTSLTVRLSKWMDFRQHIALRCKYQFQHHLWTRGYYGKVIFDHNAGTLNLKVQTDDQASSQSKDKDPKALSGGEKSYSTICLLLALWESIQCPIRCLDEFDVFMDSVNRRISMKMMVDTANTSDKQYILITPQDMSHVALGPTVRVHRMRDPERNQTQLSV